MGRISQTNRGTGRVNEHLRRARACNINVTLRGGAPTRRRDSASSTVAGPRDNLTIPENEPKCAPVVPIFL